MPKLRQFSGRELIALLEHQGFFGGKPIIRGHRVAVEHVLDMLAAGDAVATILAGYTWMERDDVLACLEYARRIVGNEFIEPSVISS